MRDRIPQHPGRVQLTPTGQANVFDMTMADGATELGTPPIKRHLLPDAVAQRINATNPPQDVGEALGALADNLNSVDITVDEMKRTMPAETINTAMANLQATIDSLPRLLNRNITIQVAAGTTTDEILIEGFFGSGHLIISGAAAVSTTHTVQRFIVSRCTVAMLDIRGFNISATTTNGVSIGGASSSYVRLIDLSITGGVNTTNANRGVECHSANRVEISNTTISNKHQAVAMSHASNAVIVSINGVNNEIIYVANRSIIHLHNTTATSITGLRLCAENTGGMVLLPNVSFTLSTTMANLQNTIDGLPRLVRNLVTINVTSGSLGGELLIQRFYGGGNIRIIGASAIAATHSCQRINITNCWLHISIEGLSVTASSGRAVNITYSNVVALTRMRIIGGLSTAAGNHGIRVVGALVSAYNCEIMGKEIAVLADSNSKIRCSTIHGGQPNSMLATNINARAFQASGGGEIRRVGAQTIQATTMNTTSSGGTIVMPSGAIIGT